MKPSRHCIVVIQAWETLQLEAYHGDADPEGVWTIGWGHTGPEVKEGQKITAEDADRLLEQDLAEAIYAVNRGIRDVPTTQSQFDAMVSLCYNIGAGNFLASTLIQLHRSARPFAAADEFSRWQYSAGQKRRGLKRRRFQEAWLYCGDRWHVADGPATSS